jgi:hypothetical protein
MSPKEDDLDVDLGGPPDPPTGLEISGFEATSVSLKWKAPAKDGGAPIKEYQVCNLESCSIFYLEKMYLEKKFQSCLEPLRRILFFDCEVPNYVNC